MPKMDQNNSRIRENLYSHKHNEQHTDGSKNASNDVASGTLKGYKVKKGKDSPSSFPPDHKHTQKADPLPLKREQVSSVTSSDKTPSLTSSRNKLENKVVLEANVIDGEGITDTAELAMHIATPDLLRPKGIYQPPLGSAVEEEAAIFREMLRPFQHLPEDQRQKAVLLLIQDRMAAHIEYAFDSETEGVPEFWASPAHILGDKAKGIDCEDYSFLAEFWCEIAQQEKMLPETAQFHNIIVPGHMIFVYELPGKPPQRYVLDTNTTRSASDDETHWNDIFSTDYGTGVDNDDDLVTLAEYLEKTNYQLLSPYDWSFSMMTPGSRAQLQHVIDSDWADPSNNDNTIAASISREEIAEIQRDYMAAHGKPELPDDWNKQAFSDYLHALTAKRMLGALEQWRSISGNDLNITPSQARYLIGAYSSTLQRELTIQDMDLTQDEKIQLLGVYSPVLNRPLLHNDLALPADIPIPENPDASFSEMMPSLSESEDGKPTIEDVLKYKLGFDVEELTNPYSLAAEIGGAGAESLFVTAFAQKRLNKVVKRRKNAMRANKVLEHWKGLDLSTDKLQKPVNKQQFSDFATLCFLESEQSSELPWDGISLTEHQRKQEIVNIKQLLRADREYLEPERMQQVCQHLIMLVKKDAKDTERQQIEWLDSFSRSDIKQTKNWFYDKKKIEKAQKILHSYGIELSYNHDKMLGRFRSAATPVSHRMKIDHDKMFKVLASRNQLPETGIIIELLNTHEQDIKTLAKLDKYDTRKIRQHRTDRNLKAGSAAASIVPIVPVSDAVKSYAYGRVAGYRKKTQELAVQRIDDSIKKVHSLPLPPDEKRKIEDQLEQVKMLKKQHLQIKKSQALANSSIHAAAAVASIPASLGGPIGSGIKSGVTMTAKTAVSSAGAIDRHRKDKQLRTNHEYTTVKDIYQNYKSLYLDAKEHEDQEKMSAIAELAKTGFGIEPQIFDSLTKNQMVENNQIKLTFAHEDKHDKKTKTRIGCPAAMTSMRESLFKNSPFTFIR